MRGNTDVRHLLAISLLLAPALSQAGVYPNPMAPLRGSVRSAVSDTAPVYRNDFNTVPDVTSIRTLPGWSYSSSVGDTTVQDKVVITGGQTAIDGASGDSTTIGRAIVGYDTGSTNHFIKADLATVGQTRLVVAATNETANAQLVLQTANAAQVYARKVSASTATDTTNITKVSTTPFVWAPWTVGRLPAAGDAFEARAYGGKLRIFMQGVELPIAGALGGYAIDATGDQGRLQYTLGPLCRLGQYRGRQAPGGPGAR